MLEKSDVMEARVEPRDEPALVELDKAVAEINTRAQEGNLQAFALVYWVKEPERGNYPNGEPAGRIIGVMHGKLGDLYELANDLQGRLNDAGQMLEEAEQPKNTGELS